MSPPRPVIQRTTLVVAVLAAFAVVFGNMVPHAGAAPSPSPSGGAADPDGGNGTLQGKLEAAARGYLDAKNKLDASKKRQADLAEQMRLTELRLTIMQAEVAAVAGAAYRGGRASLAMTVLNSDQPTTLLHSAATVEYLTWRDDQEIHNLNATQRTYRQQRDAIDAEIKLQEQQVAEMAKRKADAEKALGNSSPTGGFSGGAASATPAPRNPDGSWPKESCSIKDPTGTGGCVTPRMLHAYTEARAAGFTHYTACWRSGSFGEHPLGRACDFAANTNGFANVRAAGADKEYGDRLAAWFLANADRLAVLYVIWYKQIWMSSTGWRSYTGDGTPSGDHYNHVHLSVY